MERSPVINSFMRSENSRESVYDHHVPSTPIWRQNLAQYSEFQNVPGTPSQYGDPGSVPPSPFSAEVPQSPFTTIEPSSPYHPNTPSLHAPRNHFTSVYLSNNRRAEQGRRDSGSQDYEPLTPQLISRPLGLGSPVSWSTPRFPSRVLGSNALEGSSNEGPLNISREHLVPGTPYTNFSVGLSSQQPGTPGLSQPGSLSKQHGTPSQQHGTPSQQTGTTSLQSRLSQPETLGNTRRILKPGMLSQQPGSLSQQPGSLLQKPKTPFFGVERKQNAESPTPQGREPFTDPFSFDSEDSCSRDVIDGGGLFGRSVTLTPLQRPRPGPNQHDRILVEQEDYNRILVEQEDYNRILGQQENNQDVVVDGLATRQDDAAMFVSEDAQDGMLLNEENSQASTITRTWSGRFLESYQQDSQEDAGLGLDQEDSWQLQQPSEQVHEVQGSAEGSRESSVEQEDGDAEEMPLTRINEAGDSVKRRVAAPSAGGFRGIALRARGEGGSRFGIGSSIFSGGGTGSTSKPSLADMLVFSSDEEDE